MSNMDWKAAMSSEIFREYAQNELVKEAQVSSLPTINEEQVLGEFEQFQIKVNSDPHLKQAFKQLQIKFANDPLYRNKVDVNFVKGVMSLDLDTE
jgi:hypothetical protein